MNENKEYWRPIVGYEGIYEVSNYGKVRSLDRYVTDINGQTRLLKGVNLSVYVSKIGYAWVTLRKQGSKKKTAQVHRLVASAFIPNQDSQPCVNHKDKNKSNNFVFVNPDGTIDQEKSNLEWCSIKYNNWYERENLPCQSVNEASRKPIKQISLFSKLVRIWESATEIERELGYKHSNIVQCCKGKVKSAYGYRWLYA